MKMIWMYALILSLLLFCTGCDGHVRTLYLLKPGDPKPSWSISSTTISIHGSEDVVGIVSQVAKSLGMRKDNSNLWYTETKGTSTFRVRLNKTEKDVWAVNLEDFPSVNRSEQSLIAEERIRELLKQGQSRP